MKKLLTVFIFTFNFSMAVFTQIKIPPPSTTQFIKQEFGFGIIELTYSRPEAKGRKIFGDLVPYSKMWRTGANAATKIFFSDTVEIAGKKIDTGTYVLYTIPGVDKWEIILNKGINNWGIDGYNENEDVLHFKIAPQKARGNTENFTMQFSEVTAERCNLQLIWEKTLVSIPITTSIKERLKKQIEAALKSDVKPYWQAAQYYKDYENNLSKALDNVNKAIAENEKAYWMWHYQAKLQAEMGDKVAAKISANKSIELAVIAKNDDYVKLNKDLLKSIK